MKPEKFGRWTPEEIAALRDCYANGRRDRASLLAALPSRSIYAIRDRASVLGLCAGSTFTREEVLQVRVLYRQLGDPEAVARQSGMPLDRVNTIVTSRRLNLCESTPEQVQQILRLYGEGLNDSAIAKQIGLTTHRTKTIRAEVLGLPELGQTQYRERCRARRDRWAELARSFGLPEELDPKQIAFIVTLSGGPRHSSELDRLYGYNATRKKGRLRRLKELGLIVSVAINHGQMLSLTAEAMNRLAGAAKGAAA